MQTKKQIKKQAKKKAEDFSEMMYHKGEVLENNKQLTSSKNKVERFSLLVSTHVEKLVELANQYLINHGECLLFDKSEATMLMRSGVHIAHKHFYKDDNFRIQDGFVISQAAEIQKIQRFWKQYDSPDFLTGFYIYIKPIK